MSSDQGSGTPSFGDLFDDPHAPLRPVDPAGRGSLRPDARPATPIPATETAEPTQPTQSTQSTEPAEVAEPAEAEAVAPVVGVAGDTTGELEPVTTPERDASPEESDHALSALRASDGADGESVAREPLRAEPVESTAGDREPGEPGSVEETLGGSQDAPAHSADPADRAAWDGTPDPGASSAPSPRVDTGRLYRSAGAEGPATLDAIPAIDPGYVPTRSAAVDVVPESTSVTRGVAHGGGTGLTYSGVAAVVISVTVLVGIADALITGKLGVLTGVALAVSSIYAALVVRKADIWAAVVMPPLAFLTATLTAGQLTLDAAGSMIVREGYMIFRTLAVNAPWILGTTAVCLVIVLVRRRRA